MTVDFRHYRASDLEAVREVICDIQTEVRARDFGLTGPFHTRERFDERLSRHSAVPGWQAIIGYEADEPIGFVYCTPLGSNTRWWNTMMTPLPEGYTTENGRRTLALNEIVVRKPWRGKSHARALHDTLLATRHEERVTLLVDPEAGDGKVHAVYEHWGYKKIGEQQPFPDSPVFAVMMRPLEGRHNKP